MAPKGVKTPKPPKEKSSAATGANKKTDVNAAEIPLSEKGKWTACIALLVGSQIDDDWFISGIGCSVATGCRQLFHFISAQDIYKMIKELGEGGSATPRAKGAGKGGNKDNSRSEASPEIYEACTACLPFVGAHREPPLPLVAKIIKYKLLEIKNKDVQRRAELVTPNASAVAEVKGKKGAQGKAKPGKEDDASQAKTPRPKEKEDKKPEKSTTLVTREEMEAVEKYVINDEPVDGADQYILLTGFTNPHLITFLADLRVDVNCIIKVRASNYEVLREIVAVCPPQSCRSEAETAHAHDEGDAIKVNAEIVETEYNATMTEEVRRMALQRFWCDISTILDSATDDSSLHNVARLECLVPDTITYLQLCDPNTLNEFFIELYNNVACLMYNVTMMMKHWQSYLNCLRVIQLPRVPTCLMPATTAIKEKPNQSVLQQPTGTTAQPAVSGSIPQNAVQQSVVSEAVPLSQEAELVEVPSIDMSYYKKLMDTLPVECSSVPLMMHCMLEQICYNERADNDQLKQDVVLDSAAATTSAAPLAATAAEAQAVSDTQVSGTSAHEEVLDHNLYVRLAELEAKLGLTSLTNMRDDNSVSDAKVTRARCVPFKQPELISELDDITHRLDANAASSTTSLDCTFNAKRAELEMLCTCGRVASALQQARERGISKELIERSLESEEMEKEARLQQFLSYCSSNKNYSPSEITHALQQFILECIDLAKVDSLELNRIHSVPRRHCPPIQTDIPWDDPYPYYRSMRIEHPEMGLKQNEAVCMNNNSSKRSRSAKSNKSDSGNTKPDSTSPEPEAVKTESNTEAMEGQVGDDYPTDIEIQVKERVATESFQKRSLDEFSYAEHFQSGVVLQVIEEALYAHPYVECYRCRRDGNLFVILDSPYSEVTCTQQSGAADDENFSTSHTGAVLPFQAYSDWHAELHSNVGFRYFLEYVSGGLSEWIQLEEARRHAALLAAEVERLNREQASSRGLSESERAVFSAADGLTNEQDTNADYIRAGSLKAWKQEQEQRKKQEEEQANKLLESEAKKNKEGKETPKGKDKKGKKSEGSKSPSPSRKGTPKSGKTSPPPTGSSRPGDDKQTVLVEVEDDASFYPFVGYDTRHKFIHVGGVTRYVYPPNCRSKEKSLIQTERVVFRKGEHFVKGTVYVDGHIFNIHILEPKIPNPCPVESADEHNNCDEECVSAVHKEPSVGLFGSLTGVLKDGITLALSHHGPTGKPQSEAKKHVPEPYVAPTPPPVAPSAAETASESKKASKKDKDSSRAASAKSKKSQKESSEKEKIPPATPQQHQPEVSAVVAEETEKKELKDEPKEPEKQSHAEIQPFQQLFVSCPTGLNVKYYRSDCGDSTDYCGLMLAERRGCDVSSRGLSELFVRQSYPDARSASINQSMVRGGCSTQEVKSGEWSRVITWDGTVVKTMRDGTVEILNTDGSTKEFVYESALVRLIPDAATTPSTSRTYDGREEVGEGGEAEVPPSPERKDSNHNVNAGNDKSAKKKSLLTKSAPQSEGRTSAPVAANDNPASGDAQAAELAVVQGSQEPPVSDGIWISTSASGERTAVDMCGRLYEAKDAMVYTASDPMTKEVIHTREDHVLTVFRCDDSVIVEHRDGTRITTRYVEVCVPGGDEGETPAVNPETGEALPGVLKHFRVVEVESPGYATVTFDETTGICRTLFGSNTVIDVTADGSYTVLPLGGHGCLQIGSDGRANYTQHYPDEAGNHPVYTLSHVDNALIEYSTVMLCQPKAQDCVGVETEGEMRSLSCMKTTVACAVDETVSRSQMNWPVSDEDVELRDTGAGLGLYLRTPGTVLWDGCTQLGADLTALHEQQYESVKEVEPKCYNPCGPAPRFFIINPCDLTGVELLRWSDLREYFSEADSDPSALILKDELMDCPGVTGISVMRPQPPGPSTRWILPYREKSIIPTGLRPRDLRSIPAKEVKRPGPTFGSTVGRGLCIGPACSCGCCYQSTNRSCEVPEASPCKPCPPALDYRMFLSYRPVSEDMRSRIYEGLKCCADHLLDQEDVAAACRADSPETHHQGPDRTRSLSFADVLNLERAPSVCTPCQPNQTENLCKIYEEKCNAALWVSPPPVVKQKSQSGKFDRQRAEREKAEDEELRRALRECKISPYFLSDSAPACMRPGAQQTNGFIEVDGPGSDQSNTCSSNVHAHPPVAEAFKNNSNDTAELSDELVTSQTDDAKREHRDNKMSPTTLSNDQGEKADLPTEQMQIFHENSLLYQCCSEYHAPKQDLIPGSPCSCSCHKVTPGGTEVNKAETTQDMISSLTDDIINNAVRQACLAKQQQQESEQGRYEREADRSNNNHRESDDKHESNGEAYTVESHDFNTQELNSSQVRAKEDRSDKAEVCGSCSQAVPYRDCYPQCICPPRPVLHQPEIYTSIAALQHRNMDGYRAVARDRHRPSHEIGRLVVIPQRADFGVLKEGCTYSLAVSLKNLGYDPCRFRVKQPPPSTGVGVIYSPGPVLAGLKTQLQIQLLAIAAGVEGDGKGSVGLICHNLEILTETGTLYLPITASVLTESEYECRSSGTPRGGKAVGVRVLNGRAPSVCVGVRQLKRE